MFKLKTYKNQKISEIHLVQILFYSFPLAFIVGNLIVSLNLILFIFASLFLIKRKQLKYRFNNLYWILIIFLAYFFSSTTLHFLIPELFWNSILSEVPTWKNQSDSERIYNFMNDNQPILRSFLILRFLILIFVIDTLFFNKILNLKKFFFSSLICTSFVSVDIIFQYVNWTDIFGYKREGSWNMGPFGDEWIAGTYLKNFSFFSFFYLFMNYKNKNLNNFLIFILITTHLVAGFLSGNRMPMVLFIFGYVLTFLLMKNFRLIMSSSIIVFILIFSFIVKNDPYYKNSYTSFKSFINILKIKNISENIQKENGEEKEKESEENSSNLEKDEMPKKIILLRQSGHNRVFRTAIEMWKERPVTGFGFKSFRIKCAEIIEKDRKRKETENKAQDFTCANHPHNYYLELLSEAGIIGFILITLFFLIILKDSFIYLKKHTKKINSNIILLIPIIISFFLEIWPIKSTGSFFTSWGATFFWINTGILLSFLNKKRST